MKFAHIADTHLGASFREKDLEELNFLAFKKALEICINENVDFIVMSGDIFHHSIPDLQTIEKTIEELIKIKDYGIEIYAICGSHDISHMSSNSMFGVVSIINVLSKARVITNAYIVENSSEDSLRLGYVVDKKTGVKIFGMPGFTKGTERDLYEQLDREYIQSIDGDKIFIFHSAILELLPKEVYDKNPIPLSLLPQGFRYYAGGHLHFRLEHEYDGAHIVYPGPLFGATYTDLEMDYEKGFYIVENFVPRFVPIKVCEFERKVFYADGKTSIELEKELREYASQDHDGRVLLIRVVGELKMGKPSDINFNQIRELATKTARAVLINRNHLRSRTVEFREPLEKSIDEIENSILNEMVVKPSENINLEFIHLILSALKVEKGDRSRKDHEEDVKKRFWDTIKDYVSTGKVSHKQTRIEDYFYRMAEDGR